jgi:hypothetical protein
MPSRLSNPLFPVNFTGRGLAETSGNKPEPPLRSILNPDGLNLDGCTQFIGEYLYLCGFMGDPKLDGLQRVLSLGGWAIGSIAYSPVAVIRAVVEAVIGIAQLPTAELIVLGISFGLALPLAFAAGGYISGSFAFLIGGTLIAVAFKYILILLTYIFGAALGILVYINLLLGTMGVLLIHAFHFLREARETTAGIKAGIKAAEAAKNILS